MRLGTATLGCMLCMLTLASSSGCSVWSSKSGTTSGSDKSWSITKLWKKEYQKPASMAIIWSPDVLTLTGKPPTRGFGGRVFMYNERTQAIPVKGELMVHGYRGQHFLNQSEQVKADKTFAFTAEQLTQHFSPSELGASYSIWIPWDAADGFREEVTLIPTFKGTDGVIVQGAPAKLYLPGRTTELGTGGQGSAEHVPAQSVSYRKSSTPTNDGVELPKAPRELKSTTIELPTANLLNVPRKPSRGKGSYTLGSPPATAASANAPQTQGVGVGGQTLPPPLPTVPANLTVPGTTSASNTPAGSLTSTLAAAPARPRSISPPTSQTPASATSVANPATTAAPTATGLESVPQVPKSFALPGGQVRELPAPTRQHLKHLGSPIAHEPWTTHKSIVQPASYNQPR